MRHRLGRGLAVLALASAVAACSTGAAGGRTSSSTAAGRFTTSTPAASTSTTSTTLPANAVSVVRAPVLIAHTSDGSLGYREVGAGPPLVMIMGYSGSMDAWEPSFVDALGRAHRVVIFDNAGISRTSALPLPLTITAMANQTAALIEALRLDQPDVLGWSMGGMIAQALAVLHPSLVRRLVLCATLPGNGKATLPSSAAAKALSNPSKADAPALLSLLFPANQKKALSAYLGQISEFPNFYVASPAAAKDQLGALVSWLEGKQPAGRQISQITAPTLIGDGLDDELVPVANDHELAGAIPGAKSALYPDSGHAFLFQYEGEFLDLVQRFLDD
jgi:pimeloyl-ACP methyl ester carboxylesterase